MKKELMWLGGLAACAVLLWLVLRTAADMEGTRERPIRPAAGAQAATPGDAEARGVEGREPAQAFGEPSAVDAQQPGALVPPEPEGMLSGLVVDPTGAPVPGAEVVAWRSAHHPSIAALAGAGARGDPALARVAADLHGRFQVSGLDPAWTYSVVAGSPGMAAREPAALIRPDQVELLLTLEPLCALQVRLLDQGAPPAVDARLFGDPDVSWRWPAGARWVERDDPRLVLAGVPAELCTRRRSHEPTFFFLVEDDALPVGPIAFEAHVPGYEPVALELHAPTLRDGLTVQDVELVSRATGRGSLRIGLTLAASRDQRRPDARPELGRIVLQDEHDPGRRFSFALLALEPRGVLLEGVPAGSYRVRFEPAHRFGRVVHPSTVHVTGTGTAEALLDLSSWTELELDIRAADRSRHRGDVLLELARPDMGALGSTFFVLSSPPYVIEALPPGTYAVTLNQPFYAEAPPTPVGVGGGPAVLRFVADPP